MRLGLSVPKMNAEGGADGGGGPICSSREGAERFLREAFPAAAEV